MNKISIVTFVGYISLIFSLYPHNQSRPPKKKFSTCYNAITYDTRHTGRFGDKLIMITKAAWVANKYKLPLLYRPFKYSNMLALSTEKKALATSPNHMFSSRPIIRSSEEIRFSRFKSTLFTIHFKFKHPDHKFIDLNNTELRATMRSLLRPLVSFQFPAIPEKKHMVALHVRKGGGYDKPLASGLDHLNPTTAYSDKIWPRKFPPDSYYIEQLRYLSKLLEHENMHVHIFTDDKNPGKIAREYKRRLKLDNVSFSWRTAENRHDANVLEDFFHMSTFDYLIRPGSGFSKMAAFIGNFKLIIFPKKSLWRGNELVIPEVNVTYYSASRQRYVTSAVRAVDQ